MVVGFPVEACYGGGSFYFPGTVYQVNPTQYSTSEGIKVYPDNFDSAVYCYPHRRGSRSRRAQGRAWPLASAPVPSFRARRSSAVAAVS